MEIEYWRKQQELGVQQGLARNLAQWELPGIYEGDYSYTLSNVGYRT